MTHLEIQRDFEDIIEGEQSDADLQLGRHSNNASHTHNISSSDSWDDERIPAITSFNSRRSVSPSFSSPSDIPAPSWGLRGAASGDSRDETYSVSPTATVSDMAVIAPTTSWAIAQTDQNLNERSVINYDTLELTDDEYLQNYSDSD